MVDYREIAPSPALRSFVRCFWTLRAAAAGPAPPVERIVPDGCAEIVLNRAERFRRLRDAGSHLQAEVLLVGQIRRSIAIAPTGTTDLVGIRFEPGGLFALLGIPMHELTDVDLCVGQADERLRAELAEAREREDEDSRIAAIERILLRGSARRARSGYGLAAAAVRLMEERGVTAGAVAHRLGISRRSLERAFRLEVGLAPRLYVRIRRLQAVLRRVEGASFPGWAALAAACGYADQAHLIRDFRALAGTTPRRWLAERTPLATCFEAGDLSRPSNPRPAADD